MSSDSELRISRLESRLYGLESILCKLKYKLDGEVTLRYKKLVPEARLYKKHDTDSCWDVFATSVQVEENYIEIGTGLAFDIPEGYEIKAFARSGASTTPLFLANGTGVIDESYKGELLLRFKVMPNLRSRRYQVGDRVGQIQLQKKVKTTIEEVTDIGSSDRGTKGFNSTGLK